MTRTLFTLLTAALAAACVSTVRAPAEVADPVVVQLCASGREGRHAALLLPDANGGAVEYGFGDWSWYALGNDDCWRAPAVLLAPGQGTLGRRTVGAEEMEARAAGLGACALVPLAVPRDRVAELRARLEREFAAGGTPRYNAEQDMWFVKHPRSFWMFHDCNDEVAEWLEELGCAVSWAPVRARLALGAPGFSLASSSGRTGSQAGAWRSQGAEP